MQGERQATTFPGTARERALTMQSAAKPIPLVFIIPFLAMGLTFAGIGVATGWSRWNALAHARRVDGKVVDVVRAEGHKAAGPKTRPASNKPTFAPVVEYEVDGQTYRIQGAVSSSSPSYAVGDTVGVVFPADKPSEGSIDSFSEKWLGPLVFGGGGLVFALVGVGMVWARVRSVRSRVAGPPTASAPRS
jgi:hypothetical protein